jgi:hypothetical protein
MEVISKRYPNLILFKYTQIGSKFNLNIVQEARGIILDSTKLTL